MRAMLLENVGPVVDNPTPLVLADCPAPTPGAGEILIRVSVCGVCHTELDEIEGRMRPPRLPVILGHQVVGRVEASGAGASSFQRGDRVGVAWIYSACEHCDFCKSGNENLCAQFRATGRDANGGYAELMTVPQAFAHAIPDSLDDANRALFELKLKDVRGAKVLRVNSGR
jgi:alcohol dehydrogenase, propanol-preferring